MTDVSITYDVTRDIPQSGLYSVTFTVTSATGIDLEIFEHDVTYLAFIGVCRPYAMRTFPRTKEEAVAAGLDFFRARGTTRMFATIDLAEEFVTVTKQRIALLQTEWSTYVNDFPAAETVTVPQP